MFFSISIILFFIILFSLKGDIIFRTITNNLSAIIDVTTKSSIGYFPNPISFVQEMTRTTFRELISLSTGNTIIFMIGMIGLIGLVVQKPKHSLFMLSIAILAILPIIGRRFLIFTGPVIALGLGYTISRLWALRHRFHSFIYLIPAFIVLSFVPILLYFTSTENVSYYNRLVPSYTNIYKNTPSNSIIWSTKDNGYYLNYFTRRATIIDGGSFVDAERLYFASLPFTVTNQRLSANLMHFYSRHGMKGINKVYNIVGNDWPYCIDLIEKILSAGPSKGEHVIKSSKLNSKSSPLNSRQWITFFFPEKTRPIYLFIDFLMPNTQTWYYFGTLDMLNKQGKKNPFYLIHDLNFLPNGFITGKSINSLPVAIDSKTGLLIINKHEKINLSKMIFLDGKTELISYSENESRILEINRQAKFGLVVNNDIAAFNTVFNTLYMRNQPDPKYFSLVTNSAPLSQLWEVHRDIP
jgi:hypothetical protein